MSLAQEVNRVVAPFEVISEFKPAGDQPAAIAELTERIKNGEKDVVLLVPPAPVRAPLRRGWWNRSSGPRW